MPRPTPAPHRRRRAAFLPIALASIVVVTLVAGPTGNAAPRVAQDAPSSSSRPQVVAQGVAPLPLGEAVWRVAYHLLEPGDDPAPDRRPLGFVVADAGSLLLRDEPGGRQTLLGRGEAAFSHADDEQLRVAAGDDPAAYVALELVPADADGGDGRPDYLGPPFAPPPGDREIELLRGELASDEETSLANGTAPSLLLATLGEIRVESNDGASAVLRAGEASTFGGDLAIATVGSGSASFLAAVVGPQVRADSAVASPAAAASPVAIPDASPASAPAASPVASPVANQGAVAVTLHGCPSDLLPAEFAPNTCDEDGTAAELALASGGGADGARLVEPTSGEGEPPVWTGLPFGRYELRAVGFPPGYDRVFVPGLPGRAAAGRDDGDPATGFGVDGGAYRVRVNAGTPIYRLDAYAYASDPTDIEDRDQAESSDAATPPPTRAPRPSPTPAAVETGAIAVRVFVCPGATLQTFDPAGCAPARDGFATTLNGSALDDSLTDADAAPGDSGARVWGDLPLGRYLFAQPTLPAGAATYYVPESDGVSLLPDNSGYAVVLDEDAPEIALDVYNLAPLSLPAPVVPPPAPLPIPVPQPTPLPLPIPTPLPAPTSVPEPPTAEPLPADPVPTDPPAPAPPPAVDSDGDSLTDDVEIGTYGTDPSLFDTDGDGTGDGAEIAAGTDPFAAPDPAPDPDPAPTPTAPTPPPLPTDSDGDGLADADEATYGANPAAPDTDGDGFSDGAEVAAGTNPANSSSNPNGGG